MPDSLHRLAASVVLPGFVGRPDGESGGLPDWLRCALDDGLAGVCLFGHNVGAPTGGHGVAPIAAPIGVTTAALHDTRDGVLVAADEEGGSVTRLRAAAGSPWPAHATLGALDDVRATERVARGLGAEARAAGIDLVLAPVADVHSEPDNPVIGERSFGADPALVARHTAAFVRGLQAAGVAACAKHFPGHGATRTDSHVTLPRVDADLDTWRARDLPPFAAAVEAGVQVVMTAHVVVDALDGADGPPATLSPRALAVLRDELGFDGVVCTDALDMHAVSDRWGRAGAAVAAVAAGVDLLCLGNPDFPEPYDDETAFREVVEAMVAAVRGGTLPAVRLEEASARVAALAEVAPPGPSYGTEVARRALRVTGDPVVDVDDALVLLAPTETAMAAGRKPSLLAGPLAARDVADAGAARALLAEHGDHDVVVVVEGRGGPASRAVLDAVLADHPDAVLVRAGVADPSTPDFARAVAVHGGGRAAAAAVVAALDPSHPETQEDHP